MYSMLIFLKVYVYSLLVNRTCIYKKRKWNKNKNLDCDEIKYGSTTTTVPVDSLTV